MARIGRQRTTVALAAGAALALGYAAPAHAARFGVPTNLNAAGQVCTAVGPPAGCTAVSADPPGWFVLERLDSGSANGDIVHQIRFFVEVTGTTLDIRVFDAGPSSARDLGRDVQIRYRLRNPNNNAIATATITTDNAVTQNRLARFACQDGNNTPAVFQALDAPFGATNRIFGTGAGTCAALARGLYIFEVRIQDSTGDPTYEGRNAFGVEFLDSAGTPYNAFTIGDADDDINTVAADDTSMITGAVAGDRPTANVSGYTAFFPYVNRGCTIEAINFDLDADNAEGNGSVATLVDTLGAATDLARSDNDDVATTTVSVEPTGATNLVANNYGMFTLRTRLSNSATPQNHLDWRVADFRGSTAGNPANLPRHPISPIRTYLPNDYSACTTSGCALTSPQEPVLAASAVLLSGENPPLPGGAATRFAMTATVSNPGTTAITAVQITVPLVAGATFVAGTQLGTIDGAAATCADGSAAGYRRCTFATLAAGSYASLGFEIDFQPAATGVQNLTGAPAAGSPPPNTTVWARYIPASQSTTFDRTETLGPICQLAVNAAPASDLALLTPTDNPDPVTAGSNLTYTFQLRNLGPNAAPNASVTDVLPPGTTFVSATPPTGWSCVTPAVGLSGTVRCSASSFTLTTVTFTVVVRVDSTVANGTILTNSVSATSGNTDTNTSNNALSMTTTAAAAAANADLAVTKADIPDPVPAGQDLTYMIVVTNNGPATALAVTLTDAVPAGTTFRSISTPGGWSCTTPALGGTGSVSCTLDSLSSGQLSAVTLRVRVDAGATVGSTITNTASVSSTLADPVSGNNSASATTTVADANTCPTPGKDGTGGTLSSVINTYHPGAATAAAGATSIVLGASRGAVATIAVGDLVLVVQMQDATINSSNTDAYGDGTAADGEARGAVLQNNAGGYEYAVAASAIPAAGGTLTLSQGLLNTYTSTASVTSITRGGGTGTATTAYGHGLAVGDFVTIAGANQPTLNNTFAVLATPTPTTFTFAVNGFTDGTGTITATKSETPTGQGQRRFQVVRVPQYTTATLGPTLTASYWDGSSGGVLAFDVQGTLALGGATVSVSGRGFRGGGAQQRMGQAGGSDTAYVSLSTTNYHGSKGEGTAGTPRYVYDPNAPVVGVPDVVDTGAEGYSNGSFARGAPGTAGGGGTDSDPAANDENSGGGGGGNGGLGGRGGNGWRSNASTGGFGGGEIAADPGLVTLGGGGGAGTRNNSAGDESSGNAGGGIVMIRADSLMGTGTIEANGLSANTTDTTPDNDAGGGGGAGGTVLVFAPNGGLDGLTVSARGGRGSDAWPTVRLTEYPGERHGPGGGGGGGRVFLSATPAAADVSGGAAGTTSVTPEVYGASDGSLGTVSTGLVVSQIPGIDTTGACSALAASVADLGITVSGPADTIDACTAATYTFTVVNIGPDAALDATASFPIPATTTFQSLSPASGWTCTTPSVGGTGTVVCTQSTFAAGATSGFSLTLRVGCSTPAGTLVAVTGSVGTASTDTNVPNDTTAMANLVGPAIVLLSRASIRGVRVDRAGLVEFATGWQQRTAGFRLYQTDDRTGRRDLMPLASETIPTPRPDSQLPILYSARTAPITAPYLVIEEIERGGERRFMGPFPVGDARQQTLLERIERRLARAGAEPAFVSSAAQARVVPLGPREAAARSRLVPVRPRTIERRRPLDPASVKIETVGEGVATVARESLGAAGLPVGLRLAECRLTSQGQPVPFEVRDEGGAAEALVFRAEALETLYSSRNVYVLSWGRRLPAMAVPLTSEADPTRPGWLRVARPLLYVPSVPQGTDPWLWDQLVPGFGTWPYDWDPTAGTFDLAGWPDGAPTAVPVRLRFQGMTEHRHLVSVSLNGESLGTVEFDGVRSAYLEATASQLRSTANELRIDYATADGDPDGYAYLDYLELVRPDGWQDQAVVAVARPFDDSLPPAGAEYLIVTHPLFAAQAERLAEAKRAEGMQVAVADVENAYDRLSGGIQEANAVRALVRGASARGRLRYVLLLGDDSFDPDDRAGFGGRAFVPSLNGWDGIFGRVASENRYADVNGDGRPDVAIGRLPARTPAEADRLVDKVERQQALLAPGAGRHVFAVDNPGPDGFDFAGEAHAVAARLPSRVQTWVDLAEGITAARGRLFSALAEGAAITHYFGHGGPETWADEGLLTVEDAASLPSTGTVVLTWTCQVQFFQYLFGPSVNESLLLKPDGGAVAAFGPAGITDAPLQAALYERLYDELRRGRVALGEAIRRAKARAVAEEPRSVPVVEGWNLLGDPSLAIVAGPRGLPKRGR